MVGRRVRPEFPLEGGIPDPLSSHDRVPIPVERAAVQGGVEKLRRLLADAGVPAMEANRFGRADDFALLEADEAEFSHRCEVAVSDHQPLAPAVARLLARAEVNRAPVCVIFMPVTDQHRRRFDIGAAWNAYLDHVATMVRAAGGDFLDAADLVGDSGFADRLHLNDEGAADFSRQLARTTWWGT
jgi:hypothetical protein